MFSALICSVALLSGCDKGGGLHPATVRQPLVFSSTQASNALIHVTELVTHCTPRDAGTPGSARAANWIQQRLAAHGLDAVVDTFSSQTPYGTQTFANVLATIPGTGDDWIILLSHFDTMSGIGENFQGANDGGSSTGLLIELARVIHDAAPRAVNVLCGFLDGEECMLAYSDRDGFHGSKRLARQTHEKKRTVRAVILMDMIGDRDLKITVPRNCTAALRALSLAAADATGDRDKIGLFDGIIYDDHQAFLDLGYPALDLIDFSYGSGPDKNEFWHTLEDSLDKLSSESLLATGRIVTEMINRLEEAPRKNSDQAR